MKVLLGTREAFIADGAVPTIIVDAFKAAYIYVKQTVDDVPVYRSVLTAYEVEMTEADKKAELRARLEAARRVRVEADTEVITVKKALEEMGEVVPEADKLVDPMTDAMPAPAPVVKAGVGFKRIG